MCAMRVEEHDQRLVMEQVPEDAVGRRVLCNGERATVRYVGTVPPTKGLWLGVEWDNPERGKHDGSYEGVRYFTCSHPTGGSFVRAKDLNFGVDFLSAVKQHYEVERDEVSAEEIKISTRTVNKVGFESILEKQRMKNLKMITLENCDVSSSGPENEIRKNVPNVVSLHLYGNLLNSWEAVAAITEQLEELTELNLSHNRLRISSNPSNLSHAFSHVKVLMLNSCGITWSQVLQSAPMWPQLEELLLNNNKITELERPVDMLHGLKALNLSNNNLMPESLLQISHLSRLEVLNLSNTGLSVVQFSDALPGTMTSAFPALKVLFLDDNKIAEWAVIDELEKLRALEQLSCNRNPLMDLEGNRETTRQLLIARISRLKILNKMEVSQKERKDAERDYCKRFGRAWLQSGGHRDPQLNRPSAEFTTQHPRYLTLIQKYGAPEEGELKEQIPFALKHQLLNITFECPDDPDRKPIQKKLLDSMTVLKVKGLLNRLLKLPNTELHLSYISSEMAAREIEIDHDLKPLQFYSIKDGNRILVRWS